MSLLYFKPNIAKSYQNFHFLVRVPQPDDSNISRSMEDTICLIPVQNQASSCKLKWKPKKALTDTRATALKEASGYFEQSASPLCDDFY